MFNEQYLNLKEAKTSGTLYIFSNCRYFSFIWIFCSESSFKSTSRKSVRIRSFSSPYFPAFGLNTERCGISLPIQTECGKIGPGKPRIRTQEPYTVFYKQLNFYLNARLLREDVNSRVKVANEVASWPMLLRSC